MRAKCQCQASHSKMADNDFVKCGQAEDWLGVWTKRQPSWKPTPASLHFSMQISPACDVWKSNCKSVITSADGPIVTPAYVAVCHSETADALRALQFITFIAGEMHCGSPPWDPSQREKNVLMAKVSWKNTKVLKGSGTADNVALIKTHRGHKAMWNNLKCSSLESE